MFVLIIQVITIVLALTISNQHRLLASPIVVPVNKHTDAAKPLYSALAHFDPSMYPHPIPFSFPEPQQKLLIDLDAPFIWHYSYPRQESCDMCPSPVTCKESPCTDLRTTFSYQSPSCPPPTNHSLYDGYYDCELCPVNIINPVTGLCEQVIATNDQIMFLLTNNDAYISYSPTTGSTPPWTFDQFPSDVFGVIALSSSQYALPAYLHDPIKKVIALCLPSTLSTPGTLSSPGALFLGAGPYYLPPPRSNVDVSSFLSYINLLKYPNSFGYFIDVDAIVIKNRSISVPANVTTKISTLDPYTILRTDVYNNVVRRFLKVTKRIPRSEAIEPFGVCFNVTLAGNGSKVAGVNVADIELMLEGGKKWSISTTNSMKQVTDDVACLAVVDGGPMSEHAIVVGAYQLEDNFLVFDLENNSFGFSSSLLRRQTSCSDFK